MAEAFKNSFLRSLPPESQTELRPHLHRQKLEWNRTLVEPGEAVTTVYFPESAVVSLLTQSINGDTVETSMAGVEGVAGVVEACGSGVAAMHSIVQIDGECWTAPAAACCRLARCDLGFAEVAGRNIEMVLIESRQSGLCQALHGVEQRLARWLAESLQRSGGRNPLPLTQEYLASMLGVQRTTVNAVASLLQKSGLIRYSRGVLHIVDAEGLERRACECLHTVREQRDRLGFAVSR